VDPDVVAVQEGMSWVGSSPGVRQVDDLNHALRGLGADYRIAATEITYPDRGWRRTDNYILYKPSVYRAYAAGGHFALGDNRFAAYQPLQNIGTGARFLFVSAHLHAGFGLDMDEMRQREAQSLVTQVRDEAAALGVPVIYGGDFNSNTFTRQFRLDGPGVVMRNQHVNDARQVAMSRSMERYDSMNEYSRTPLAYYLHIDYLWAPPGVAVSNWGSALRLSDGRYVGTIPSDHNPVYATMYYPY
jgi:endonuclease/exonuclease/phosphatase family metal-dependent hydrolase